MIGSSVLNYRIEKLIGTGGMGSVYYGTNMNIDQKVAIKVLNKNLSDSSLVREWFKNEANLLCKLDHPNIVKFLNFVENEDGIFLIMEYVDGISLDDFIMNKNGLIVEERVYEMFNQILDAFAYAHKQGIVHRDIKPANIILTPDNEGGFIVKILDFGIAGFVSSINENKDWVVGTPSYMSPEQVNNEEIDQRSDIYSLGVLLHQMLTGRTPYDATTLSELMIKDKVVKEPLPRMKDYYAYVSEKLQKIVDKAVDKDKSKRYQSCAEFKKALNPKAKSNTLKYALIAVLVVLFGAGGWYWDYNRVKVEYYKDYVEQWGVPQGIHKLSSSEQEQRVYSYKFTYQNYKLQRMCYINSCGSLERHNNTDDIERPTDMQLFYQANGTVDYVKVLDMSGKVLYIKDYNNDLKVAVFKYDDEYGTERNLSANTVNTFSTSVSDDVLNKSKISRYLISYDENGYVSEIKYAGFQNVLVTDNDGIAGRRYINDEKGRIKDETFLNLGGEPKAVKSGMAIRTREFNDADDPVRFTYLSVDREASGEVGLGVPVCHNIVDKWGNTIEQRYEDLDGNLVLRQDSKIAGTKFTVVNGLNVSLSYIGTDGAKCYESETSVAECQLEYDKNGYVKQLEYFDIDGRPMSSVSGEHKLLMTMDDNGNQTYLANIGSNGEYVQTSYGHSILRNVYDELGNTLETSFYDQNDSLTLFVGGYAKVVNTYDSQNRLKSCAYYDNDNMPTAEINGIYYTLYDYSVQGNLIKRSFYGADQQTLILSSENIAGWNSIYDDNGNEVERNFFNAKGEVCLVKGNYAQWKAKYDERGNQTELAYYGTNGQPIISTDGYASSKSKFDDNNNVIEEKYYDTKGSYAKGKFIFRYKFDKYDNPIEVSVFDHNDKPTLNDQKWHKQTRTYNSRNLVVEECCYGVNGKLTTFNGDKFALAEYNYDDRGNRTETQYYDINKKPCLCNEGWSYSTYEFDNMNRVIKQSFFDVNKKPTDPKIMVPEGFVKYDKWGNVIFLAAGDGSGKYIINPQTGWSIMKSEYDVNGNTLAISYHNTDESLMISKQDGYAKVERKFDSRGNQTEECYFDAKQKPILSNDGYSKVEGCYDERGNSIEMRYYDTSYNLRKTPHAIIKKKYDEENHNIEVSYFNHLNKPCLCDGGWHKETYSDYVNNEATYCRLYGIEGYLEGFYKWINNQWTPQTIPPSPALIKAKVAEFNKQCPFSINDQIEISGAKTKGSIGVVITFRLVESSKYNLSQDDINGYKEGFKQVKQQLTSGNDFPNGTQITIAVNDKANRLLFEL